MTEKIIVVVGNSSVASTRELVMSRMADNADKIMVIGEDDYLLHDAERSKTLLGGDDILPIAKRIYANVEREEIDPHRCPLPIKGTRPKDWLQRERRRCRSR